jgi:putative ABC transport system substrate-binding protein
MGGEWRAWYARLCQLIEQYHDRPDDTGRFARRLLREMDSLWVFLAQYGVDPTNNRAERALRFGGLWRKRSLGTARDKGNRWVERILSLKETCRLHVRTTYAVLGDAVTSFFHSQPPDLSWINAGVSTAAGQYERFPDLATELVRLKVDVLMMPNTPAALAAKHATTTIPIVMVAISDPVGSGLVASLARPGGNVTGLAAQSPELVGKQLEFLKEVLPTISRVAILWNPANPVAALMVREAEVAAQPLGVQLHLVAVRGPDAFDSACAAMTRAPAGALLVLGDAMFLQHRRRLAELAATSHLPTMHNSRAFVEAGGLIGYGVSLPDAWRRAATYVDKILKGAKPTDLPVEQPTRFELVINLKTAQALGITMPPSLLLLADEVIR